MPHAPTSRKLRFVKQPYGGSIRIIDDTSHTSELCTIYPHTGDAYMSAQIIPTRSPIPGKIRVRVKLEESSSAFTATPKPATFDISRASYRAFTEIGSPAAFPQFAITPGVANKRLTATFVAGEGWIAANGYAPPQPN